MLLMYFALVDKTVRTIILNIKHMSQKGNSGNAQTNIDSFNVC